MAEKTYNEWLAEARAEAAEAAEAKLAKVEALADEWAGRWDVPHAGRFEPDAKAYRACSDALRAALADAPAEQRAEGGA